MTTSDQRYHFNANVLPTITLEHAKQWTQEQDAVCWIEYTFLDPNDLPRSNDMIARVENRFECLLRRDVENQIAGKLIDDALELGCTVSVNDGQDWCLIRSQDKPAIMAAMASTDADRLQIRTVDGLKIGDILLIWGNGADLISDCTDNESTRLLLEGAEALAETLQG